MVKNVSLIMLTPDVIAEPADLLIFAVKYTHLQEAIEAVRTSRW